MSVQESGKLRVVAALDERARLLEQVQERTQAGPCVDAWRSGQAVTVPDLSERASSWGTYPQQARAAGIVAVASIPMRLAGQGIGAVDLYSGRRRVWAADDLAAAHVLADMAACYVLNASELERQRRLNRQLQEALDSRVVIEQAKGVLAAELGVSVDRAFEVMRRHARSHNASLRTVAHEVVHRGLRP